MDIIKSADPFDYPSLHRQSSAVKVTAVGLVVSQVPSFERYVIVITPLDMSLIPDFETLYGNDVVLYLPSSSPEGDISTMTASEPAMKLLGEPTSTEQE